MDISIAVNNSIPLWGILCAGLGSVLYIIRMDYRIDKRISMMEKDMKSQGETLSKEMKDQGEKLDDIKGFVYQFLTPKK